MLILFVIIRGQQLITMGSIKLKFNLDMGLSYKMLLDSGSLDIRVNIKNVFDMRYIEYLNTVDGDSGVFYNGIDTANEGQFGLGRTWSVGMRYNF
mgnify:CR=1 FL=1